MDINIENVRKKLLRGEKLSTNDLRSLEPLHDAIYDNDGRVVGVNGGATGTNNNLLAGDFNLDYLDRSFLDGRHNGQRGQSSERLPRLVRYVGKIATFGKETHPISIFSHCSTFRLLRFLFLVLSSHRSLPCLMFFTLLKSIQIANRNGSRPTRTGVL